MKIPWLRFLAVSVLFLGATAYISLHKETAQPLSRPLEQFPSQIGEWRTVRQDSFSHAVLSVLRPSDYLSRSYQGPDGQNVTLYIGYHDGAQGSGPIHSPRNCLPGNGWFEISSRQEEMNVGGERVHLTQTVYRQGERQELFLYWYMVQGRTFSSEVGLKLAEIANSVRTGHRGASFVRLSLPSDDDPTAAAQAARSFLAQVFPVIHSFMSL